MRTAFWWGNPSERGCWKTGVDRSAILKWIFKKQNGMAWTGLIWLRIGTSDGLLFTR
jgi:hypothetical protein